MELWAPLDYAMASCDFHPRAPACGSMRASGFSACTAWQSSPSGLTLRPPANVDCINSGGNRVGRGGFGGGFGASACPFFLRAGVSVTAVFAVTGSGSDNF